MYAWTVQPFPHSIFNLVLGSHFSECHLKQQSLSEPLPKHREQGGLTHDLRPRNLDQIKARDQTEYCLRLNHSIDQTPNPTA